MPVFLHRQVRPQIVKQVVVCFRNVNKEDVVWNVKRLLDIPFQNRKNFHADASSFVELIGCSSWLHPIQSIIKAVKTKRFFIRDAASFQPSIADITSNRLLRVSIASELPRRAQQPQKTGMEHLQVV